MMQINGREYTVQAMPVTVAMAFSLEVIAAGGPSLGGVLAAFQDGTARSDVFAEAFANFQSAKLESVIKKAIAQCLTEENTYLKTPMVFEQWFNEYPEDLFPLAGLATYELVSRFLPRSWTTLAEGLISKAKVSTSPKGGK